MVASHGELGAPRAFRAKVDPDTSYLCVVDEEGNAFSATPSDGVTNTPVIPGLGFIVSGRGGQSWVEEGHPERDCAAENAPASHPARVW